MSNTFLDPVTGLPTGRVQQTGSNVADGQTLWTPGMLYNETTSDKPRGNTQGTLLASAVRTATILSSNQINYNSRGVVVTLNITAASGTGGLQVFIIGKDALGNNFTINATPTSVTTAGTSNYVIYPGVSGTTPQITQQTSTILPRTWYCQVTHVDATSYTYSLTYSMDI